MRFQPLRTFLNEYLPMLGIPGSDTSIYQGDTEVFRYQSGYGNIAKKTPVNPDGLYNIYSCTKVTTVCALLTLLEKGEIHLYDPVYVATREESGVLGFPSRRVLTPRGRLECIPEIHAFPGEEN